MLAGGQVAALAASAPPPRGIAGRGEHADLAANEVGDPGRKAIELALGPTTVDRHVDIAVLAEALAEGAQAAGEQLGRRGSEIADHRHRRLLRRRRKRPRGSRCAAGQYELAPSHVARAMGPAGVGGPPALTAGPCGRPERFVPQRPSLHEVTMLLGA